LLVLAGAAVASAQPPATGSSSTLGTTAPTGAPPHPLSQYGGVTPGHPNPPPRVETLRARGHARGGAAHAHPNEIIAWPGFQMQPSGGSRFFVQTTGPVTTEVHASEGRVEIVFHDTAVHLANSRRWLETQFFETPVVRARLERRRRDMVFVMQLRAAATPMLSTGTDPSGFTFTYIDFGAGHFVPDAPIAVAPPPTHTDAGGGTASVRPAAPDSQTAYPTHEDDERPPPVQMH
jgi:hypothetical protein